MYGISALVPLTSQGNNVTGWRRKMLAVFTLANVFSFYFQSTNAAGYTAVYITVNVSYINLMFFVSEMIIVIVISFKFMS